MASVEPDIHPSPAAVEAAMDAAWPAAERHEQDGWVFRASNGVTQRANSIWPRLDSGGGKDSSGGRERVNGRDGLQSLLREARSWYRSRRLPVIFQVFDDVRTTSLNALLDAEGFTRQSETLILTRGAMADAAAPDRTVDIAWQPPDEWLQVWWAVDGRGGAQALATARGILEGCPSLYAMVRDDDGRPAAVGRLAVPGNTPKPWGGLYCMATRPDARRQGYGSSVLAALLQAGAAQGLEGYWLLVTASNSGAQELYARAGFRETGRYLYRQERPRRALTGC